MTVKKPMVDVILSAIRERRERATFEKGGAVLGGMVADLLHNVAKFAERDPGTFANMVDLASRRIFGDGRNNVEQMERFVSAWIAHQDAGFDPSRAECERIATEYGVAAPPFCTRPSADGLGGWKRLHDYLIDRGVVIDDTPLGDQAVAYIESIRSPAEPHRREHE